MEFTTIALVRSVMTASSSSLENRNPFSSLCLKENRLTASQKRHIGIGDPVRCGNHHLVILRKDRLKNVVERVFAPKREYGLVSFIVEVFGSLEIFAKRVSKLGKAGHRRVLGLTGFYRFDGGLFYEIWRVKIWFHPRQTR